MSNIGLSTVLRSTITNLTKNLRVALPGRIESYDSTTQKASVKPLISDSYLNETGERVEEPIPVIDSVPVVNLNGGGFYLTFPIKKGDIVLLIFSSSSLDRWLSLGGEVDPLDDRRHDISDAIAIPGLKSFSSPLPNVPSSSVFLGKPSNGIEVTDSEVKAGGSNKLATHQDLVSLKNILNSWTPVAMDGGAALKTLLTSLISTGWPFGTLVTKGQ